MEVNIEKKKMCQNVHKKLDILLKYDDFLLLQKISFPFLNDEKGFRNQLLGFNKISEKTTKMWFDFFCRKFGACWHRVNLTILIDGVSLKNWEVELPVR